MKNLFKNEELLEIEGFPTLTYFEKGEDEKPLVVFITGGGVLGRIAYGYPEGDSKDFLAYWFKEKGYSFLALTYPMEHPVFSVCAPEFSITDWGKQTASAIDHFLKLHGLKREVICLAWSMGGRLAQTLGVFATQKNIHLLQLTVLCASMPSQSLLATIATHVEMSEKRMAVTTMTKWLQDNLDYQNTLENKVIIPQEKFGLFFGNYPVNLGANTFRYRKEAFIQSPVEDFLDAGAWNYDHFPFLSLITHACIEDSRHALLDKPAWVSYIYQIFYNKVVNCHASKIKKEGKEKWEILLSIFNLLHNQVCTVVEGSHFLFLGEKSAQRIVDVVENHRKNFKELIQKIQNLYP